MKTSNENSVITKKDLKKMFWRSLPMEFSWHYERQMHMGFCTMISDGLRKIYKNNPEGLKKALQRHLEYFCWWYYIGYGRNECQSRRF